MLANKLSIWNQQIIVINFKVDQSANVKLQTWLYLRCLLIIGIHVEKIIHAIKNNSWWPSWKSFCFQKSSKCFISSLNNGKYRHIL